MEYKRDEFKHGFIGEDKVDQRCFIISTSTCRFMYVLVQETISDRFDKYSFFTTLIMRRSPSLPVYVSVIEISKDTIVGVLFP